MKNKALLYTLILPVLLIYSFCAMAAPKDLLTRYNFTNITMNDGLLHNFIDDICKDKTGFLWISTMGGGLSRYDGYEFKHYNTTTWPVSLKSNFIRKSCEDNFNRLWIASEKGVDILNLSTQQLNYLAYSDKQLSNVLNQPAYSVLKDSKGNIWLSTENSLYKIEFQQNGSIAKIHSFALKLLSSVNPLVAFREINGEMWIGYNGNIYKALTNKTGQLILSVVSDKLRIGKDIYITVLFEKENEVWIGTDHGLFRYNKTNETLKHYIHSDGNQASLSQNLVTDLAETADRQLLVSTLKGLNFYDPMNDSFMHVDQDEKNISNSINCNFINCLLTDKNLIWLGTEAGGLNKMMLRKLSIHSYVHSNDPTSISKNPVNAIYEDKNGDLWVGTVEGGLNRKPKNSEQFIHYTSATSSLSHNSVSTITADDSNKLWIGTWGKGINILDISKSSSPTFQHINSLTNPGFLIDFIGTICYDPINKGMWIGSYRGIFFYDIKTNKLSSPLPVKETRNIQGVIGSLIDKKNKLWMGTSEGVMIIDLKSFAKNHLHFSFRHIKCPNNKQDSHCVEKISCIYESSDGALWLGSNGYGLYKLISRENDDYQFQSFTTSQGLANNCVFGILEDERGMLWLSTNNGLSCYNPKTNRIMNYTKGDGIISNQFYWNAYCKSRNNKLLYFGNIDGLTALEGNKRQTRISSEKVILTKLNVQNEIILPGKGSYLEKDISLADCLHLHESDKSFSIEFAVLNYENPNAITYSYRLLGFDDNWVKVPSNRRFASYTNLRPGTYTLQVKCDTGTEEQSNNITELNIVVSPFFYKTAWFICLSIFFIAFLVYRIYKWRIYTLKTQKELLRIKVEERTRELEGQKLLLENKTNELSRQNELLKQQNEKITRQKGQLIKMSKKVQELTIDKLAFFTNITHEFRTPITLIMGPIERALKLSSNPQVIEQLHFVERNSRHLLSLVNQLMDFRKVESGKIDIVRTPGNLPNFIDELLKPFEVFASERSIRLEKRYRLNDPTIMFDEEAMTKVISNLLSNAIKFTPNNGNVTIYISSLNDPDTANEKLFISVKDTGTGIAEEDLSKIFNRFYQSKGHVKYPVYGQSGTGIGLYLCKRIVSLQGGRIHVKNNKKQGAAFRVLLPLLRKEKNDDRSEIANAVTVVNHAKEQIVTNLGGRLNMLVVEDNKDMRDYIRSILTDHYNVFEAENGSEALTVLNLQNIDFIISDLMMPVMDGIEFSRKVKENFAISHIPFLMLTAKTSVESRIESFKIGVDEYLLKPFDEDLLLARINNILENRKRYQKQFSFKMDVDILNVEEESCDKKFLDKAMTVIKENYKNSYFEVSDFIESMGVSKSILNKKMQNLTGQSAGQFIRNYRLNIGRELILRNRVTKNMNISEIAYEIGFNDPKYFTRCFTKHFGVTPSSLMDGEK